MSTQLLQLIELDLAGNRLGYPAAVSVARFAQRVYRERSVRLAALSLQENRSVASPPVCIGGRD